MGAQFYFLITLPLQAQTNIPTTRSISLVIQRSSKSQPPYFPNTNKLHKGYEKEQNTTTPPNRQTNRENNPQPSISYPAKLFQEVPIFWTQKKWSIRCQNLNRNTEITCKSLHFYLVGFLYWRPTYRHSSRDSLLGWHSLQECERVEYTCSELIAYDHFPLGNWQFGTLWGPFGERVVYNMGTSIHVKVDSIIWNGQWKWPKPRNIIDNSPPDWLPDINKEDSVQWLQHAIGMSTVKSAWNAARHNKPIIKSWYKVAWGGKGVPRWPFIYG